MLFCIIVGVTDEWAKALVFDKNDNVFDEKDGEKIKKQEKELKKKQNDVAHKEESENEEKTEDITSKQDKPQDIDDASSGEEKEINDKVIKSLNRIKLDCEQKIEKYVEEEDKKFWRKKIEKVDTPHTVLNTLHYKNKSKYCIDIVILQTFLGFEELYDHTVKFIIEKLSENNQGLTNEAKKMQRNNYWVEAENHHFGLAGFNDDEEPVFLDSLPNTKLGMHLQMNMEIIWIWIIILFHNNMMEPTAEFTQLFIFICY